MKRVTLPALSHGLRRPIQLLVIIGSIGFVPILAHATSTSPGANTTSVNVLLNYGNGTLVWYNQTLVPSTWNFLNVNIDVQPGGSQPVVNLKSQGVVPVAILSTSTFDATKVNPLTVKFGRTGTEASPVHSSLQDVNGDGLLDMVLQFKTQSTGFQLGDSQATLMGRTLDGTPFRGSSAIQVIGS